MVGSSVCQGSSSEQGLGKTTVPKPMGDIETATKGSAPTTNVQDYNEAKGHAQVRMSCVEGLVDVASMDSQTEAEMVQSHSSNGLGYEELFEIKVEVPWKPQVCGECKIFDHATSLCPSKPKTQAPSKLKQEWKAKEVAETQEEGKPSEWVEVKKKKGKDVVDAPMVNFVPTPPPSSSNAFNILNSCVANKEFLFVQILRACLMRIVPL
ncbi:uncharacterized protein LOC114291762 [Camellia sinensis]|uniref:uncharacterized protein LOC114291762 n=1 Tax=Camellia sinensis TaxID=4442 RepID=UPI0010360670|nr:uncharacterized protein LOC114291762 [Camellia sinensis]